MTLTKLKTLRQSIHYLEQNGYRVTPMDALVDGRPVYWVENNHVLMSMTEQELREFVYYGFESHE